MAERTPMTVSSRWVKAAVVTFIFGFAVLGYLAARIISGSPPVPKEVQASGGEVLFTRADIHGGAAPLSEVRADAVRYHFRPWRLSRAGFYRRGSASRRRGDARHSTGGKGSPEAEARARVEGSSRRNAYDPRQACSPSAPARPKAFSPFTASTATWFGPGPEGTAPPGHRRPHRDPAALRLLHLVGLDQRRPAPGYAVIPTPTTGRPKPWPATARPARRCSGAFSAWWPFWAARARPVRLRPLRRARLGASRERSRRPRAFPRSRRRSA